MLQSKREKFLMFVVFLAVLGFIGTYLYSQMGDNLFGINDQIEQKKIDITNLLDIQEEAVEINSRYEEMKAELTLEGSNPEQDAAIRQILMDILNEVGLNNRYGSISPREQRMEDEFKTASISITQIRCTPQQLGQLLYRIEKQSEVMDVVECQIQNLVSDIGKVSMGRGGGDEAASASGLLDVDLEIARLIDYRQGEKPKKRSR
ncbi:MAG: hypothetical protein JXR73_12965 [Candidatus Omnitrophica bacterium]|nr:hypothetical protein [Candidatus Omnitrophota bacterium]